MLYSIVGLLVIILDQAVKYWVANTLFGQDIVKFIPGVISLVNVHNDGAAFSFLSGGGARIYFIIATGVFAVLVVIALATNFISGRLARWSIVLVTAGGLSNMIDRVIYGYVQDMFKVELFNFAIFNVADVFITVFSIVFVLAMLFEKEEPEDDEEDDEPEEPEPDEVSEDKKAPRRKLFGKSDKAAAEMDEPAPKKQPRVNSAKQARQQKYEAEYEQYKAQQQLQRQRLDTSDSPAVEAVRRRAVEQKAKANGEDPFAAWEAANAKLNQQRGSSLAGKAMGSAQTPAAPVRRPAPVQRTEAPAQVRQNVEAPDARNAAPTRPSVAASAPRPAAPAPSTVTPAAPAAKPKSSSDDFDLDDILAEFK